MLTALDIQNKEFSKGLRGYDEEEVDVFLDEIIVDYQKLLDENAELKSKLGEVKSADGSVIKTLESAKALLNDISASAEKRANMIIQNAELEAQSKLGRIEDDLRNLQTKKNQLESDVYSLKIRLKNTLEAELERIELMDKDVLGE